MESRFATPVDMRASVFFDGPEAPARYSRFWMLLVLSSIIASAGVVADSTAAVIGAMIVAPLLGPIQGTMLATVLGDRANLVRSLLLVVAGAAVAIAIGFAIGLTVAGDVVAAANSQVAGRVSPRLIDLLAALEAGAVDEAFGALLLFVTNVVAIIATGIVVMSFYGVNKLAAVGAGAAAAGGSRAASLRKPVVLLISMLIIVGIPLSLTSLEIGAKSIIERAVVEEVETWGAEAGWRVQSIDYSTVELTIHLEGPLPVPDTDVLDAALLERGVDPTAITIVLIPVYEVELGG